MNQRGNLCYKDILCERLAARLRQAVRSRTWRTASLLRLEVDVDGLTPTDWLAARTDPVKIYWANRDGDFAAAGVGVADVLTDAGGRSVGEALAEIQNRIAATEGAVRWYGGICFDPDDPRDPWRGFGRFRFFVPRIELRREHSDTILAVNICRTPDDTAETLEQQVLEIVDGLVGDHEAHPESVDVLGRTDLPDRAVWAAMVDETLADIAAGRVDKLVLARQAVLPTSAPVDISHLLGRIANVSAAAYGFCLQLGPHDTFLCASPECLFSRHGRRIRSEALAGTALAGGSGAEERRHRGRLSESVKDSEEHAWVVDGVRDGLERLCDEVRVIDRRDIVSLGYVQHFRSRFAGRLRGDVTTADIIDALHPTAAVNGHPRDAALAMIRSREPFTRGWYAGPVGWIGADNAEFAVGIRSARVLGNQVFLFAGAGIVRGSDPDGEWDETESKLSLLLNAIA